LLAFGRWKELIPRLREGDSKIKPMRPSQDAIESRPALLRVFHLLGNEGLSMKNGGFSDLVRLGVRAFALASLLVAASGCLATRSWVDDQLRPITGQQERFQTQLSNLHLERRLVLDSSTGPTFASGSAALSGNAKREIDQFLGDLEGSTGPASAAASDRVFVVAGYTDKVGHEDYNYELGQRRATSVAGYLVVKKGLDPTQVRVVSYGASKPVADNSTRSGRRSNRRVEILVYQEKITAGS
jgi:outer membrane protein OmpA-like peptidoglycan-associated protein